MTQEISDQAIKQLADTYLNEAGVQDVVNHLGNGERVLAKYEITGAVDRLLREGQIDGEEAGAVYRQLKLDMPGVIRARTRYIS